MSILNNFMESFNRPLDYAEEGISDIEEKTFAMIQSGEEK